MAWAMAGVPASNFHGSSLGLNPLRCTSRIMSPPPMNGGIAFSSSRRPHSAPMPVGPSILWPEKAMKSMSNSCTFTGMCGTAWHASTMHQRARPCARPAVNSFTGLIVPTTFDMEVKLKQLGARVSSLGRSSRISVPSSATRT